MLASLSLVTGTTPVTAQIPSAAKIHTSKKVLSKEAKAAQAQIVLATKRLKIKEKALATATKRFNLAKQNLDKLSGTTVKKSTARTVKSTVAAKALKAAQKELAAATALVASRTADRDQAKADVVKWQAKFAWLTEDLSTLECGLGTKITYPNGAIENVDECGLVYQVNDGDTVYVKTTKNELVEVRNIGLQTPEMKKVKGYPEQCGATLAKNNLASLLPTENTVVQLRSLTAHDNTWGGMRRPERSIYAFNPETALFDIDVQAEQMKAGMSFYWPSGSEWTHNKEYLGYLLEARANQLGIWNPSLCGQTPSGPELYLNSNAPSIGTNIEPVFGEYVVLHNPTSTRMDISGWSLRDGSLDFFSGARTPGARRWEFNKSKFLAGTFIPANGNLVVYISNPNGYTLTSGEVSYFRKDWRMPVASQISNGYISRSNPENVSGDGVYLLDKFGNVKASMLSICSTTVVTCDRPTWMNEVTTASASRIIPWPITLSMVANATKNTYKPTVYLGSTVASTISGLTAKHFLASIGTTVDGPSAAGTPVEIRVAGTSKNVAGTRVPIAVLPANNQYTALTVHAASGYNLVPDIANLAEADAVKKLADAGFANVEITYQNAVTVGAASTVEVGRQSLSTTIHLIVNVLAS
jgi:endonuclease YncB( thermonuclease family)